MLLIDPNFGRNLYPHHSLIKSDWYESFSQLLPSPEFLRLVRCLLPLSWSIHQAGIWTHTSPANHKSKRQGWKIHVSARPEDCEEILERCTGVCVRHEVAFKFLADRFVFNTVMLKGGARESSGKFITIYPSEIQQFREVADDLCDALSGFNGPYILSDKRYKDSQVIHYRYGAFMGVPQLSIFGHIETVLQDPNGTLIEDGRSAFFNPPSWIPNPFDSEESDSDEIDTSTEATLYLKNGKYLIDSPIHFSVGGGVYRAVDMDTARTVIIKEARPHTSVGADGMDSMERLRKEHRLLQKLSGTGVTPEPLDLFEDWEHLFLVEEYIPGDILYTLTSASERRSRGIEIIDKHIFTEGMHKIWTQITNAFKTIHEHNIIINDVSPGNVIIAQEDEKIHLIDLEGAWEIGVDPPYTLFGTAGFRIGDQGVLNQLDDIYGLGRMMCSMLFPGNMLLNIKPEAQTIYLDLSEKKGVLSSEMKQLLSECLDLDEKGRPSAANILNRLENISIETHDQSYVENFEVSDARLMEVVDQILKYIKSNMSFNRTDRLFPADPSVFLTNPLSVAHGAAGVAYALSTLEGEVSDKVITWMLSQEISNEKYTPGLYLGLSGIAWVFWVLEQQEIALRLMKSASEHPLLWELPDIYYGASGFGLACLYFHKETQDEYWLEQAVRVGDWLIQTKAESEEGYYWPDTEGNVWCSYARGQSGIALYLLYLRLASGESRFEEVGRRALSYDLGQVEETRQGIEITRAASVSPPSIHKHVASHYWSDGSAGVCTSLVRYWFVFKDDEYKDILDTLMQDTARDLTAFPTLFTGLAGLGNLQLDVLDFTRDTKYIDPAFQITNGILRFQLEKPDGIAFPGEQLLRISNDFGSGSAGIALFLARLANREKKFNNFNFLLDDLLCPPK